MTIIGTNKNGDEIAEVSVSELDAMFKEIRNKTIDYVMVKAKEIQEEQIKNLENSVIRNGKQWAIYMNTHLGHIQVACKRLIIEKLEEQLKEGGVDG